MFTGQRCHSLKNPLSKISAICEAVSCTEKPAVEQARFVSVNTEQCVHTLHSVAETGLLHLNAKIKSSLI